MGKGYTPPWKWSFDDEAQVTCDICGSKMSAPVSALYALPSITSDCRSWTAGRSVKICEGCGVMKRIVHPLAEKDFENVYVDYVSYPEPEGRTAKILGFVKDRMPEPKSVLDVGCGQGVGLDILSKKFPKAFIAGYDPYSAKYKDKPFNKFDLITLFHVLEHVEDAHEMLSYVKSSLTKNGHVLIQVPYALMWPFDLVLADHWWHFSGMSLVKLLNNSGFNIEYLGNDIIKKEFTLLARIGNQPVGKMLPPDSKEPIEWLLSYKSSLDAINERVAVYGTGPAAAWTGNILGDKVVCYYDDDKNRIGKNFNGKMVYDPSAIYVNIHFPVVAPFPDWQIQSIKDKNLGMKFIC